MAGGRFRVIRRQGPSWPEARVGPRDPSFLTGVAEWPRSRKHPRIIDPSGQTQAAAAGRAAKSLISHGWALLRGFSLCRLSSEPPGGLFAARRTASRRRTAARCVVAISLLSWNTFSSRRRANPRAGATPTRTAYCRPDARAAFPPAKTGNAPSRAAPHAGGDCCALAAVERERIWRPGRASGRVGGPGRRGRGQVSSSSAATERRPGRPV